MNLIVPIFSFAQENNRKDSDPNCIERADNGACARYCKGIKLNTDIPFIGDCIGLGQDGESDTINGTEVNAEDAFPTVLGALMRILTSAMLIIGLLMIIAAGVMMTTEGVKTGNFKAGKNLILKVGAVLALLGLS
ncbi:MAG: hypothetical protein LBD75_04345 [Candidatus Peribacteria bacterium]|nr:hypothetical protein [Candidatus Peribacteria bacterium]